jgi:hypothetical protein
MDNQTKLDIAKKRLEAENVQTQKQKEQQDQFVGQLESFVGDLNRILSAGINISDSDKLDGLSDSIERLGVEAVSLVERVALCVDRFSELTIPEHIELHTDSLLLDKIDQLELEIPEDLTKRLVQLDATIVELSKALKTKQSPSKLPDDFQPVRIVVGDEGALRFLRDMPMPFFSGGGGSSSGGLTDAELRATPVPVTGDLTVDTTGLATETKQDATIAAIEAVEAKQLPDGHEVEVNNLPTEYPLPSSQVTTLTPQTDALTDTQLRASPLDVSFDHLDYQIYDIAETTDHKYFGFRTVDGEWKIMRKTLASNAFRYVYGTSDYSSNWTNRGALSYV